MSRQRSLSPASLQHLWSHLPGDYWVVDSDLTLLAVSKSYCKRLSAREDYFIGKNIATVFKSPLLSQWVGGAAKLKQSLDQVITTGQPVNFRVTLPGTPSPTEIQLRYLPVADEHQRVTHVIHQMETLPSSLSLQDTDQQPDKQFRKFHAALSHTADFIYTFDLLGRFTYVNQSLLDLWGIPLDQAIGKNFQELGYPADLVEKHQKQIELVVESGKPLRDENYFTSSQGVTRYYEYIFVPFFGENGELEGITGSTRDITDRKNIELALRRSEEGLLQALRAANMGTWHYQPKTDTLELDSHSKLILGFPSDIPTSIQDVSGRIPPKYREQIANSFTSKLSPRSNGTIDELCPIQRPDGTLAWVKGSGRVFFEDPDNPETPTMAMGVIMDITAAKELELSLRKAKEESDLAYRTKEEFLAVMSHEIRTPLSAITSLSYLLTKQHPRADQQEYLDTLQFSAQSLLSLINNILDFSKLEQGRAVVGEQQIRLRDSLESLLKMHTGTAADQQNRLILHYDQQIPELLYGDFFKMSQVLQNLLSNAIKFTSQGEVILEARLEKDTVSQCQIEIAVKDTGIGISPDKQAVIFEAFTQADASVERKYGGTGLGLSISNLLLNILSSDLQVESEPGIGSRFFFTITLSKRPTDLLLESTTPAEPPKEASLSGRKVLIVEDVITNRVLLKHILKTWWDVETEEASSGSEAINLARQKQYDVILMDIRMPEMDGYQATRAIRDLPNQRYENTPILALTADSLEYVQKHPSSHLFTDVIVKPYDPERLKQLLLASVFRTKSTASTQASAKNPEHSPGDPEAIDHLSPPLSEIDFSDLESVFSTNPHLVIPLLEQVEIELDTLAEKFEEAILQQDSDALTLLIHNGATLMGTLNLNRLKSLLVSCQDKIDRKNDVPYRWLEAGRKMINVEIAAVQDYLEAKNSAVAVDPSLPGNKPASKLGAED